MFDLKRPCVTCPFRKGQASGFQLGDERLDEIRHAPAFQCHKTVDYSSGVEDPDTGEVRPDQGDRPQQCAGLMTLLHRLGEPNQIMQVAERLGSLDPATLDPRSEVYESWEQMLAASHGSEP